MEVILRGGEEGEAKDTSALHKPFQVRWHGLNAFRMGLDAFGYTRVLRFICTATKQGSTPFLILWGLDNRIQITVLVNAAHSWDLPWLLQIPQAQPGL